MATLKNLSMVIAASVLGASVASADMAPEANPFAKYADPAGVVLAVETPFEGRGAVRLSIYDDEEQFLEEPTAKHQAALNGNGIAILKLGALTPGTYAFVAYYDENGDGVLNRGKVLGKPKEPYIFSNGVKPKLRKPNFDEAKIDVVTGSVIVMTIED